MADTPYPLPKSIRQTEWLVGDGSLRYGPFGDGWGIFDEGDVLVETRPAAGGAVGAVECVIEKATSARYAPFYVNFPTVITSATEFRVTGLRGHERDLAVTRGGAIEGVMLELELSKQAVVLQEQRRDIDGLSDRGDDLEARTLRVPDGETIPVLLDAATRAGKFWASDGAGHVVFVEPPQFNVDGSLVSLDWNFLTATPTSLAGFGISDAYTKAEVDAKTWSWASITGDPPIYPEWRANAFRASWNGDYDGTVGFLAHLSPSGSNKATMENNAALVVRGTATAPDNQTKYAHTAMVVELHASTTHTVAQSVWGNPYKTPAFTVEAHAHTGFEGEIVGVSARAYSSDAPTTGDNAKKNIVGLSALGQTNTGAGNLSYGVWGANIIAAQTSGLAPHNCVGIEVDIINNTAPVTGQTAPGSGNNYTAFWAQAAGNGVQSSAAFFASRAGASLGWNYFAYSVSEYHHWMIYLKNTRDDSNARGAYIETDFVGTTGRVLELVTAGQTQFYVDGAAANPVFLRVGSSLKNVQSKLSSALVGTDLVLVAV